MPAEVIVLRRPSAAPPTPATHAEGAALWLVRAERHQAELDRLLALAAVEAAGVARCKDIAARIARERS